MQKGVLAAALISGLMSLAPLMQAYAAPAAAYQDGQLLPPHTVRPLLQWVADRMGADEPVLPAILLSQKLLQSLDHSFHLSAHGYRLRGAYVPGVVVLDNTAFDWSDVRHLSYLVHELVHHVQHLHFKTHPCTAEAEAEAYRLQNEWLSRVGHDTVQVPAPLHTACVGHQTAMR